MAATVETNIRQGSDRRQRDVVITARATPEEAAKIREAAAHHNMSVSQWVRVAAMTRL